MFGICEKYITIGGEAPIIGEPMYLIRFSGCNLSCSYCDTYYKDEVQYQMSFEDIIEDVEQIVKIYPDIKVLFTGGEPLLNKKEILINKVAEHFDYLNFYIETNGSIEISDFSNKNVHYVVDWKTPSSGYTNSFCKENVKNLRMYNDCVKFVVGEEDLDWTRDKIDYILKRNPFISIYLSPQWGKIELPRLADFIINNRLPVKMSIQLHKIIWGDRRGV